MRLRALDVLCCPHCLGPLDVSDTGTEDVVDGTLVCRRDSLAFPIVDGIPHLVRPDSVSSLEAFAKSYGRAWQRDGWGAADSGYLLNLPYCDTTGRQSGKWRVKARSMEALFGVVKELQGTRIVDLGAGVGWLSHHLARRGYEVYAVDALLDEVLGLGAAAVYVHSGPYFERIWGEIDRPPFRDASIDIVVCNASLHYALSVSKVLQEINRMLRPGGALAILNSPVHRDAVSAIRARNDFRNRLQGLGASEEVTSRYHHFTRDSLEDTVSKTVGPLIDVAFDPGVVFRMIRRVKGLVLGMEIASFPLLVARKPLARNRAGY